MYVNVLLIADQELLITLPKCEEALGWESPKTKPAFRFIYTLTVEDLVKDVR